jgi:outer membrane protein assembly factor BamB
METAPKAETDKTTAGGDTPSPAPVSPASAMAARRRKWLLIAGVTVAVAAAAVFVGGPMLRAWRDARAAAQRTEPLPEPEQKATVTLPTAAAAGDWPQWRGPNRDGKAGAGAGATGLLREWPAGGPRLLWTFDAAGEGHASPAVVGGKLFLPGSRGGAEYLLVLDAADGRKLGEFVIGHYYDNDWGGGPRATPTVEPATGRVYALSGDGALVCADLATGTVVWRKHLVDDLGGIAPGWGYCEGPTVIGDRVFITPGGPQGAVAALDKATGAVLWRSKDLPDPACYSSLVPAEIRGVPQLVLMTFHSVAGVSPADGRLLWRYPRDGRNAPVPTPVVAGDRVYATSGYGVGCDLIDVKGDPAKGLTPEAVYSGNKTMVNHHGGVILHEGRVFGFSDGKGWVCQDLATGKMKWNERDALGKGCVSFADGRFYCLSEADGTCCLVEPSAEGWKEKGRFKLPRASAQRKPSARVWAHPVIAHGRLYLRDRELVFCYDIAAASGR